MALFAAGAAVEAASVSWRFRGSKNTPFKPVDLPLPVSCGEVRAALKEEIGLIHTPQLDALLFFAEDEETSQAGVAAPAPLSDFLTLCRPCRVVLQRTSAAAAAEALARADAVFQGAAQRHEKQPQQNQGRAAHPGQPEGEGGEGMSVPLSSEQRLEQAEESSAASRVHRQRGTGAAGQERQPLLGPAGGKTGAAAAPAESVRLTSTFQQQQQHPHHVQRLQQEGPEGVCDRASEEEAQKADDRAADEEAEAALLHAVIEQHAEHRGPQQQQATNEAGLRGGWAKDGKGGAWGGMSGGLQQQHGRRNLVWSRDGVGSSSAASVAAATTCIPMATEGGGAFAAYGRGVGGAARGGGGGSSGAGSGSCYYGYCYYFPVDADYICHFCGERGTHHIKNCSKAQDPRQQKKVKPATGIPSSFLQDIDVSDIPAYQEVYIRRETKVERHTGNSSCTSQLRCGLCNTLFKNPVITPCCGETFCRGCLLRALQQQLMLNRFEEQQQSGLFSNVRGKVETGDGFARVKQELPATEKYLPRAAIADGALERGRRCRGSLQQSKAHSGATGNALHMAKGGGSFGAGGAVARKAVRGGGLCPACGSALDLKDVVDNVALRKCVDAIVLPSSSHEDSTAQALHQKQQQNKQQEQQQWQQQRQTQQQTRRLVKGQKGGGGVEQQLQDQVNQKKVQSLFVVKQEEQKQVKKEQQQLHLQSRAAATASPTPANPSFATHSSDSREEVSTAGASVVSAARVVVKTEAGAATSSSATVNPPSSGVTSLDSNGSSSASVLPLASLFSDVKKIQHHEDSPAVPSAAAADTHRTSADAASAAPVAPSCTSALAGFCAGLQSTVQQHETTGTGVATAAPTITRSGSTQHVGKVEEQRTGSSTMAGSRSSTGRSNDSHSSASSINQSITSDTHLTTAAADGSAAAVHIPGGPPPLLPAASPPRYASGACRASGMNSSPNSCSSSSSCEAVHGIVQGEKTDSSVVTNAATIDTGASGAETQGDRASASKSGVLTGLDISQLQEQQDFAAAYIQQYMERKKDKVKKRKKKRRRHAESSSTDTDSSSSEERSHGKKYKRRKKRMSGHHSKGR